MGRFSAYKSRFLFGALSAAVLLVMNVPAAMAAELGSLNAWTTSPSHTPLDTSGAASVNVNGYAYVIGGSSSSGDTWINRTSYAKLNTDGTVGSWHTSSNTIPQGVYYPSAATANGYIYVMGGYGSGFQNGVYYTKVNSDGSIGAWSAATSLPQSLYEASSVVHDGYLYLIGGLNGSGTRLNTVYYAKINDDGTLGSWATNTNSLPSGAEDAVSVIADDRLYVMGGSSGSSYKSSVYYADFTDTGSVGGFTTSSVTLPQALDGVTAAASNGYLYIAGGNTDADTTQNGVYYTKVNSDGSLNAWTTSTHSLPQGIRYGSSVVNNGYWYVITGQNTNGLTQDTVYYAQLNFVSQQNTTTPDNKPLAIATPAGTNLTTINTTPTVVADTNDAFSYPLGLTSFTLTTDTIENRISLTFQTDLRPSQVIARKYNSTTHLYSTIPGAVVTDTTLSGKHALLLTYTIADGGPLDEDGQVNGSIVDPVGLAQIRSATATMTTVGAPGTGYGKPGNIPPLLIAGASVSSFALGITLLLQRRRIKT